MTHHKLQKASNGKNMAKRHPALSLYQRAAISSRHYVGRSTMQHSDKREELRRKAERSAQRQSCK